MKTLHFTSIGLCLALISPARAADALLWIEGEGAVRSETHRNAWFDAVDPQELSGGGQIANFSETTQPAGWAE